MMHQEGISKLIEEGENDTSEMKCDLKINKATIRQGLDPAIMGRHFISISGVRPCLIYRK